MSKSFLLEPALGGLAARGRYRSRRVVAPAAGCNVIVDGKAAVSFSGNDYLGLARHPAVVAAFRRAASLYGVGSGASHLVTGHSPLHEELEERLADFLGRDRALLFSSGYAANLGVASALLQRGDVLIEDKLNHASLLDGARLSSATLRRYAHADVAALVARLNSAPPDSHCLVATDGVFSMDGDLAPLVDMTQACERSGAWLMVDDAHGFGVLGRDGRGSLDALGCGQGVQIYMATLGKALGVGGAFVAGSVALIETLIQKARTYVYTTAAPPAMAAATLAALDLLMSEGWRRDKLHSNIGFFRRGAASRGLRIMASETAIQPLVLGDDASAVEAGRQLLEAGFLVVAIRPPTVPEGAARLRITLSADHDEAQIDRLLDALESSMNIIRSKSP